MRIQSRTDSSAWFVSQANLQVRLIHGKRQSAVTIGLVGDLDTDKAQIKAQLNDLRALLPHLPEDPHLLINEEAQSSEVIEDNQLIDTADIVDNILSESAGLDVRGISWLLVAIIVLLPIFRTAHWFASHNFNWDWSLVHSVDKAGSLATLERNGMHLHLLVKCPTQNHS